MRFRASSLPFAITVIAMPLPWLIAWIPGIVAWAPEGLTLTAMACLAFAGRLYPSLSLAQKLVVLTLVAQLLSQVIRGQAVGSSAVISVVITALAYLSMFRLGASRSLAPTLIRQTSFLYATHVVFVLLEIWLMNSDRTQLLTALSNGVHKSELTGYGTIPQSLWLQSQAAAQICVFAATWFAMLHLSRRGLGVRLRLRHAAALVGALAAFALYPNTTMTIVAVVLCVAVIYAVPLTASRFLRLAVPTAVLLPIIFALSTWPSPAKAYEDVISKMTRTIPTNLAAPEMAVYELIAVEPFNAWLRLSWLDKLTGVGGMEAVAGRGVEHGDVGILITLFQIGAVLATVSVVALLLLVSQALVAGHMPRFQNRPNAPWVWLACANALIALGYFLSIAHYTVSLQVGGRTFFSWHLAITMLSLQQLRRRRRPADAGQLAA